MTSDGVADSNEITSSRWNFWRSTEMAVEVVVTSVGVAASNAIISSWWNF